MAEPVAVSPSTTGSRRRLYILVGVGLGLLVFCLVGLPMLTGGGGGGDASSVASSTDRPIVRPKPADPSAKPIETLETFSDRDPFESRTRSAAAPGGTPAPAASAPAPAPAPAAAPAPQILVLTAPAAPAATPAPASPAPAASPGPAAGTAPAPTTAPPTGAAPREGQKVALLDVVTNDSGRYANVRVGSTIYEQARAGDVFATSYKVVSLTDRCGTFLFGDDKFQLCKGEETVK
jgi:hypothetical protein